jgi:hypothetical protein
MVLSAAGYSCGTSAACAESLLSRRARAATAAAAHVQRVMRLAEISMPVELTVSGSPDEVRARLLALGREWRDSVQPAVLREHWYRRCYVRERLPDLELRLAEQGRGPELVADVALSAVAGRNVSRVELRVRETRTSLWATIVIAGVAATGMAAVAGEPWVVVVPLAFLAVVKAIVLSWRRSEQEKIFERLIRQLFVERAA